MRNRLRWRVVMSTTDIVFSLSSAVSRMEKATLSPCCEGCADWWHGEGSIDLNLRALAGHV